MRISANATNEMVTEPGAKKENKILNTVVNIILVLVILFAIFVGYSAYATKVGSGVPSVFGIRVFSIQSDSMLPTFAKGDLAIDKAVSNPKSLKKGDIITFWTVIQGERVLNTHRIVQVDDYGTYVSFTTKGDNNTIEDSMTVHQSEVVGKYLFRIPKLGSFLDFLQTSKGFMICIVIPVALFFIYYLVQFFRALFAYQAEKTRIQLEAMYNSKITAQQAPNDKQAEENRENAEKTEELVSDSNKGEKPKKKKVVKKVIVVEEEVDDDEDSEGTVSEAEQETDNIKN